MFIEKSSTYTAPVTAPAELLAQFPDTPDAVPSHLLVVKSYNSPSLLDRALGSIANEGKMHITPVVVDDSTTEQARQAIASTAAQHGATYCAVRGEDSLTQRFSDYLQSRGAENLAKYLWRIVTPYPKDPGTENCGGVNGAQNMSHLVSAMVHGQRGVEPERWLATFIDHDVVLPPNASDILQMIRLYHNLGRTGIITSDYTHHSGSPTEIGQRSLQQLAGNLDRLTDQEIEQEFQQIMQRHPGGGLLDNSRNLYKYSAPAMTMDFPAGNYSLSGSRGYEVPIPIVGLEDQGYGALLQLLVGAREIGVARVPEFMHVRECTPESVNGSLTDYFANNNRYATHDAFLEELISYAKHDVPDDRIAGFGRLQAQRREKQLASLRGLAQMAFGLARNPRLQRHSQQLRELAHSVVEFARRRYGKRERTVFEPNFVPDLIDDIKSFQAPLIAAAYSFGAEGHLAAYTERLKASTSK